MLDQKSFIGNRHLASIWIITVYTYTHTHTCTHKAKLIPLGYQLNQVWWPTEHHSSHLCQWHQFVPPGLEDIVWLQFYPMPQQWVMEWMTSRLMPQCWLDLCEGNNDNNWCTMVHTHALLLGLSDYHDGIHYHDSLRLSMNMILNYWTIWMLIVVLWGHLLDICLLGW